MDRGESNGKAERRVSEQTPKALDVAVAVPATPGGAPPGPFPFGRVSNMAERQREREPAPNTGGMSFSVNLEQLIRIAMVIAAIVGVWWSIKGDLREIRTSMDYQTRIQEERYQAQLKNNEAAAREQKLLSLTVGDIEKSLIRAGIDVQGAEVRITGTGGQRGSGR